MRVGLAVDVPEFVRVHGAERVTHSVAELAEPRIPACEGALYLSDYQAAVALDFQVRGTVVDCALYAEQ